MKTSDIYVNKMLMPSSTLVEVQNAIAHFNLKLNDLYELYDMSTGSAQVEIGNEIDTVEGDIAKLQIRRKELEFWVRENLKSQPAIEAISVKHTELEQVAIMGFMSDKRFAITE